MSNVNLLRRDGLLNDLWFTSVPDSEAELIYPYCHNDMCQAEKDWWDKLLTEVPVRADQCPSCGTSLEWKNARGLRR